MNLSCGHDIINGTAPSGDAADLATNNSGDTLISDLAQAGIAGGDVLAELGAIKLAGGLHEEAAALYRHAVMAGTSGEIFENLAKATFPGDDYRVHLAALHTGLKPAAYLEIGVFDGDTLALARAGTVATGVDPAPRPAASRHYSATTTIHRATSDEFFAQQAVRPGTEFLPIDLAFIDGLHHFDQVLRDVINVERMCHGRSVIVLHDTLPVASVPAMRHRASRFWCGDVWKIVPCLRQYRPDLTLLTIPTFPSGLTIVVGLDPASTILADRFDEAVAAFAGVAFNDFNRGDRPEAVLTPQPLPNDPAKMLAAIDACRGSAGIC